MLMFRGKEYPYPEWIDVILWKVGSEGCQVKTSLPFTNTEFKNTVFFPSLDYNAEHAKPFVYAESVQYIFEKEVEGDNLEGNSQKFIDKFNSFFYKSNDGYSVKAYKSRTT